MAILCMIYAMFCHPGWRSTTPEPHRGLSLLNGVHVENWSQVALSAEQRLTLHHAYSFVQSSPTNALAVGVRSQRELSTSPQAFSLDRAVGKVTGVARAALHRLLETLLYLLNFTHQP